VLRLLPYEHAAVLLVLKTSPVGEVEGLLHAVAMVHVDVNVQHPRVHLQQLQDAQQKPLACRNEAGENPYWGQADGNA
jgi:hypothetical protein